MVTYGISGKFKHSSTAIEEAYIEANVVTQHLRTPPGTDGQVTFQILKIEERIRIGNCAKISILDSELTTHFGSKSGRRRVLESGITLENDAFEWYWKAFHFSEGGGVGKIDPTLLS